jgi:hypothetical protein
MVGFFCDQQAPELAASWSCPLAKGILDDLEVCDEQVDDCGLDLRGFYVAVGLQWWFLQ